MSIAVMVGHGVRDQVTAGVGDQHPTRTLPLEAAWAAVAAITEPGIVPAVLEFLERAALAATAAARAGEVSPLPPGGASWRRPGRR